MLTLIPMLAHADHSTDYLEGKWNNDQLHKTIKIKTHRNSIRVKGLYSSRYVKFLKNHRGQFVDNRGNKIILDNAYRIVFFNRSNGLITPFRKQNWRQNHHCGVNCAYCLENRSDHEYYDLQYRDQDINLGSNNRNYQPSNPTYGHINENIRPTNLDQNTLQNIEGTWRSTGQYQRDVIVLNMRDGIKVKDVKTGKWYRYYLTPNKDSVQDEKGNQYIYSNNILYWKDKNENQIIRLELVSKDTF